MDLHEVGWRALTALVLLGIGTVCGYM
jgi:hypothetical protein